MRWLSSFSDISKRDKRELRWWCSSLYIREPSALGLAGPTDKSAPPSPFPLSILLCAQQESAVMSIFVPVNLTRFCCHLKCHCNLLYTLFFSSIQPSSSFWMISYRRLGAAFSQQFAQTNGWSGLNRLTGRSCWWWLSSSSTEGSFGWPMKDSERLITGSLCFH